MMNTRRPSTLATAVALTALLLAPACKKKEDTTPPDDAADTGDTTPTVGEVEDAEKEAGLPEQEPDPPEIAALYQRYLQGDYEAVAAEAEELRAGLTADTQVRAHALASSLAALAEAETVPESAKDASEQAVADGERLEDADVRQLGHIAHAAYLVGILEAAEAQAELEAALQLGGTYEALNHLVLAEAHLNQAFGQGEEDTQVKHPERLDDAKAAYEKVLAAGEPIVQGHAHEGLAAVAKFQNDKEAICTHAQEAENLYAANGASDYIREVPSLLAKDGRCKKFEKAQ